MKEHNLTHSNKWHYNKTSPLTHFALISLVGLSVSGCGQQQAVLGQQAIETPPKSLTELKNIQIQPKLLWTKNLNSHHRGHVRLAPAISGNNVIAVGQRSVSAWNLQTGAINWTEELGQTITAGVTGNDNIIFVGTANGGAVALDSKTGKTRWAKLLKHKIVSISPEKDGKVVFRTINGNIHTLSTTNGALVWQASQPTPALSLHGSSAPVLAGPYAVVGFDNGSLIAYKLKTGKQAWAINLGAESSMTELARIKDIDAELKIVGTTLFANSYQGRLAAIDIPTASIGWDRKFSSHSGIDANKKELFITEDTGKIWKFNPLTGAPLWENNDLLRRQPTAPTIVSPNHLVVGDKLGYLHWYTRLDGKASGRILGDPSGYTVAPLKQGNKIYTLSKRGMLSAFQF
ncbi:MAG: outer membrane protein assembly factor BamB [Thiotrichaceae bacterium]|nr:outer membrane protein assembly factor BamB [Thiotrichaceae bacterium]